MNGHFLGKKLRCFPTKLNIFHTNLNDNLKNRCHSKIIIAVFNYCLNQLFP